MVKTIWTQWSSLIWVLLLGLIRVQTSLFCMCHSCWLAVNHNTSVISGQWIRCLKPIAQTCEHGSCQSNLCLSWGYEWLQKSKDSLKACFENVISRWHFHNKNFDRSGQQFWGSDCAEALTDLHLCCSHFTNGWDFLMLTGSSLPTCFLSSADLIQNKLFWKIISGIWSECQIVWIQIRPNLLSAWSGSKLFAKVISRRD